MARLAQIVVDCVKPPALARFWAAALEGFEIRPYDEAEIARLAGLGLTPDTDPTVLVDGPGLELCFQWVENPTPGKRRLHLDLVAADRTSEVHRLVELGAESKQDFEGHTLLTDPEGNEFCVADEQAQPDS